MYIIGLPRNAARLGYPCRHGSCLARCDAAAFRWPCQKLRASHAMPARLLTHFTAFPWIRLRHRPSRPSSHGCNPQELPAEQQREILSFPTTLSLSLSTRAGWWSPYLSPLQHTFLQRGMHGMERIGRSCIDWDVDLFEWFLSRRASAAVCICSNISFASIILKDPGPGRPLSYSYPS